MPTFVGLDCGGSTSRVLAVDERGEALFRGQSGGANLLSTPEETMVRNLRKATEGCPAASAVCGAFAGLVNASQRERAESLLRELFPGAAVRAEADYAAAHAAAPPGTHVTAIAGTGSLVCGNDGKGRLVKSGGRGYLLGDEASGYRFGHAALVRFLRHPDVSSAGLRAAVETLFDTREEPSIVAAVYAAPAPQALLARLLSAFAADLAAEEAYAEAFAVAEEDALATLVAAHVQAFPPCRLKAKIALAGGVWKASDAFARLFTEALARKLPHVGISTVPVLQPPVRGAVALAKEMAFEH